MKLIAFKHPYFRSASGSDGSYRSTPPITLDENIFHDCIIFPHQAEYTLLGEKKTVVYYVVWFDFVKTASDETTMSLPAASAPTSFVNIPAAHSAALGAIDAAGAMSETPAPVILR
jgi:hypothetical protein